MNGTVAIEAKDTPRRAKSQNELAEMIRDRGCRTSSGPAATAPRKKAGHMTEADQPVQNVKTACQPGPSTYGGPGKGAPAAIASRASIVRWDWSFLSRP